ncbi:MAG: hypothetical protein JRG84_05805 [Deltaproteobacteria bacterium]|nr:hypothetical protein [Deltaproteobacteria bacterium]
MPVPPRGILKERDGPIFLAFPDLTGFGRILLIDAVTAEGGDYTALGDTGFPLGLIFDPTPGADPREMLLADSGNLLTRPAGLYEINEAGGVSNIARNGALAIPYRLDSHDGNLVYLTDLGGENDPDGDGEEPFPVQPPQVVRIDRSIDPAGDFGANQTVISSGGELVLPIGIVILEENGVKPDSLLVSDIGARPGGALIRIDFDPTSATPDLSDEQTIVAEGDLLDTPWELKIVPATEPVRPRRIFVTDTAALPDDTGIVYIDPDGDADDYVTGFTTPNAVVVDPEEPNDLIVADADDAPGGIPSIWRVTPDTDTTGERICISPGPWGSTTDCDSPGGSLVEPTGLIVDAGGDILVVDREAALVLRIDRTTGAQTPIVPPASEDDFFTRPVGIGIDPDGYLQVVDEGDDVAPAIPPRVIRINPDTGKQFCIAEGGIPGTSLSIDGVQDIIFDAADDTSLFSVENEDDRPILRFIAPGFGSLVETTSPLYVAIRHTAIAENRDLVSVDAGVGRVLRLDPIFPNDDAGDPTVVAGSEGLVDPRGIAVAGMPRPNPEPLDSDGDGILDPEDNCIDVPNPDQADLDTNDTGDVCDDWCDTNDDGAITGADVGLLAKFWQKDCDEVPEDDQDDCNRADCAYPADGAVTGADWGVLAMLYGRAVPGSSGSMVGFDNGANCRLQGSRAGSSR